MKNKKGLATGLIIGIVGVVALIGLLISISGFNLNESTPDFLKPTPESCKSKSETLQINGEFTLDRSIWSLSHKAELKQISVTNAYFAKQQFFGFGDTEHNYKVEIYDESTDTLLDTYEGTGVVEGYQEAKLPYKLFFQALDSNCDNIPEDDLYSVKITVENDAWYDFGIDEDTKEVKLELVDGKIKVVGA